MSVELILRLDVVTIYYIFFLYLNYLLQIRNSTPRSDFFNFLKFLSGTTINGRSMKNIWLHGIVVIF